jgi:predicted nucleic acid-binding protein
MTVVVCDANLIIDLLQVDLFKSFLKLKWDKHVPPDVIDEVQEDNTDQLVTAINAGKLILPTFSPEDLTRIQKLKTQYSSLSIEDCSCLCLAESLSAILLTGERRLSRIATESHRVKVHGILWVFEQLIEEKIITQRLTHAKLAHLMKVNNRLPRKECERLLKLWKKSF